LVLPLCSSCHSSCSYCYILGHIFTF
jgi:hypothetical protein